MAISHFTLDYLISVAPHFRYRPDQSVLELGESEALFFELNDYLARIDAATGLPQHQLRAQLMQARADPERLSFKEARLIYEWLLRQREYRAIDLGSRDPANWIDLNYPTRLRERFDIVINNGTSEHVFNQANVFKFMHDHAKVGGMMIHYTHGLGWVEHGFYNVQPSFFFDLAKYNGYRVLSCCLVNETVSLPLEAGKINGTALNEDPRLRDAMIHCCMQRWDDAPFRYPIQRPYQPS